MPLVLVCSEQPIPATSGRVAAAEQLVMSREQAQAQQAEPAAPFTAAAMQQLMAFAVGSMPLGQSYTCVLCQKIIHGQKEFSIHKRTHRSLLPYQCTVAGCDYAADCQSSLKSHKRTHTGERPYVCVQCGQRFREQSHLTDHKRIHTGEKPYGCDQCGKKFTQHAHLNTHIIIHTGKRPYVCDQCGKGFTQQGNLGLHKRRKHRDVMMTPGGQVAVQELMAIAAKVV